MTTRNVLYAYFRVASPGVYGGALAGIVVAEGFGATAPTTMTALWLWVLIVSVVYGLGAWGITGGVRQAGFASTLPLLRQRLVVGQSIVALVVAVSLSFFVSSRIPIGTVAAVAVVGASLATFAWCVTVDTPLVQASGGVPSWIASTGRWGRRIRSAAEWIDRRGLRGGLIAVVALPAVLIAGVAIQPAVFGAVALCLAVVLLVREYRRSGVAYPAQDAVSIDTTGTRRGRVLLRGRPKQLVPPTSAIERPFLRWFHASLFEQKSSLRAWIGRRLLQGPVTAGIFYWFFTSQPRDDFGLMVVVGTLLVTSVGLAKLSAGRLYPLSRDERAHVAYVAGLLNITAVFVPLALAAVVLFTVDPWSRLHQDQPLFSLAGRTAVVGALCHLAPIAQWLSARDRPRIGKGVPTNSWAEYRGILALVLAGVLAAIMARGYEQIAQHLRLPLFVSLIVGVAVVMQFGAWYLIRRDYRTLDLIAG